MTAEEIRAKFPNPVSASMGLKVRKGEYCVGGALVLAMGADDRFRHIVVAYAFSSLPMAAELSHVLMFANPDLDRELATMFASLINGANDNYEFERAWELLGEALDFEKVGGKGDDGKGN